VIGALISGLGILACTTLIVASPNVVGAQPAAYPTQPVRLVVGTTGGAQDLVARLLTEWLSRKLGQPFIVDVRPGAGTAIASEAVARAAPDGYTLLLVGAPNAIGATLAPKPGFEFLRDIAPVAGILRTPEVLIVRPSLPVRNLPELLGYAKANPGRLNFASPGNGTGPHMSAELLRMMARIDIAHIPYRGGGPAMNDLLGGQVDALFIAPSVALPHIRARSVRALAVTSRSSSDVLSAVPAIGEYLDGYESGGFFGIGAPRGTPLEIIDRLNREINNALADDAIKARISDMGATPLSGTAADFGRLLADETAKWARVIRFAGIKPE